MTIRVLIADDQELVRMGLRVLLGAEPDTELVGEATSGTEAVRLCRQTRPDVVLMDIRMPDLDGIEALRAIGQDSALSDTKIIMLTTFELDEYVFDSLAAGASGFLIKDSDTHELLRAIRVVAGGESLLSPSVTKRVVEQFGGRVRGPARAHPRISTLTQREREIVALVAEGLSNDEIAQELVLSPATVRTHVGRALMKLDARDRAQLVVFAVQSGVTAADLGLR